jgi:leucyl-tRNA synthetase
MALHDLGYLDFAEPFQRFRANGTITRDGGKMSKSRGNVVSPDGYIDRVGADAFRTYLLFMGPYEAGGDFSDRNLGGVKRFLDRAWQLVVGSVAHATNGEPSTEARRLLHLTIQRVTNDVGDLKYNTAVAALMKYANGLRDSSGDYTGSTLSRVELRTFVQLLAPFAPYMAEELWERLGEEGSVHASSWPEVDELSLQPEKMQIVVEVNGRVRGRIEVPSDLDRGEIEAMALASESVRRVVGDHTISRVIYIPGRLVSLVVP